MVSVRGRAVQLLITGGVIVGVILVAQRFGVGTRIIGGFGDLAGVITQGPLKFLEVFAQGAGSIGEEAVRISENFQRALSGGLLASEQELFGGGGFAGGTITPETLTTQPGQALPRFLSEAFRVFTPQPVPTTVDRPAGTSIFDVATAFTRQAQEARIATADISGFGGFTSAQEQEAALQKAIAESRQRFSQFFKV